MKYENLHYTFDFNLAGFTIKFKAPSFRSDFFVWAIESLFWLAVLVLSVLSFLKNGLFYGFMFLFMFIVYIYRLLWLDIFRWIIRAKRFMFKLNEDGIFCSEINKSFFIGWNEIRSFGFVDKTCLRTHDSCTTRGSGDIQTCMYFSKSFLNNKQIRYKCYSFITRHYLHNSSEDTIIFGFLEDKLNDELLQKIRNAIYMYLEADKEINFLKN